MCVNIKGVEQRMSLLPVESLEDLTFRIGCYCTAGKLKFTEPDKLAPQLHQRYV